MNAENYQAIYAESGEGFRKETTQEQLTELLEAIHKKLGKVKATSAINWRINTVPGGTYILLEQATEFEQGAASETFTYQLNGEKAVLYGYHINSKDLITK